MKAILKSLVPPAIWQFTRWMLVRPTTPTSESEAVRSLRVQHMRRNSESTGNWMVIRDSIELQVHPDSRWGFEHFCFMDTEMVDELDNFLSTTVNCRCLLDIGALHGLFSLAFTCTNPDRKAIAIDASRRAFCRLLYNIHHNPHCQVTPVELAISDRDGVLKMSYEWEHAVASGQQTDRNSQKYFEVPMASGDALCERLRIQPDCIKIDVEGHEASVLRGLSGTIRSHRPLIFLEVHPGRLVASGESVSKVAELLQGFGYTCSSLWGGEISWPEMAQLNYEFRVIARPDGI